MLGMKEIEPGTLGIVGTPGWDDEIKAAFGTQRNSDNNQLDQRARAAMRAANPTTTGGVMIGEVMGSGHISTMIHFSRPPTHTESRPALP